jgi:PAS domain S-box-containing protein
LIHPARIAHHVSVAIRRSTRSFAATTLAVFVVATLVPLGLALIQARSDLQSARTQTELSANASARAAAQNVDELINLVRDASESATLLDGFWHGSDTDRDRILSALARPRPEFNALLFYTADLAQHGSSNPDTRVQRPAITTRAYAREALVTGQLSVTAEPLRAPAPPFTPVLPVAVPVHGTEPEDAGLVVAGLKLDKLPTVWDNLSLPAGSSILLVDARTATILAASSPAVERIGHQATRAEIVRVTGEATADGAGEDDLLVSSAAIDGLPWHVLVEIPAASVLDPLAAPARARVLTTAGLAVWSLVLLVALWRRITARLRRLQDAAAAWGAGDLGHRVDLDAADELGRLGRAFDRMADDLLLAVQQRGEAVARAVAGEQQSRMLLDQASDAILVARGAGQLLDANAQACAMLGYSRAELLSMNVTDLVVADGQRAERVPLAEMVDGSVLLAEGSVQGKDGSIIPVEVSARLLSDGRLQAIVRDITARKRAEAAQRKHAEQLAEIIRVQTDIAMTELEPARLMDLIVKRVQALTGASGAVVELVDGDEMVYEAASGSAATYVGYRLQVSSSFSGLCVRTGRVLRSRDTQTDSRVDAAACRTIGVRSMVAAPLKYEQRVVGVLKVVSTQPAAFTQHHVASLELLAGLLGAALGHGQAFAERTRAEARARAAAERLSAVLSAATESAIIGVDLDGRVTFFNTGAERILGYAASELIGQRADVLLDSQELHARAAQRGIQPGELFAQAADHASAHTDEYTYIRKDGSRMTALVTVTRMRDIDGTLLGFVSVATDVTARRAVEKMRDEFVSVVSHELRTPLTSIRGSLGLLAGGVLGAMPPRGERMLNIAVQNTDRLLRLINDMLDLERMRSGRVEMERSTCDLGQLMRQAVDVMRSMAEQGGVRLEVDPLASAVCADADRMLQVLTNLISNAVKFSEPGARVTLAAREQSNEAIRIEVRDQGRGIPAEHLERVFERFQQVDSSDSRAKGGTGLGLAICRMIVEQHGGRIWAESDPGAGTTMIVELPAATVEPAAAAHAPGLGRAA